MFFNLKKNRFFPSLRKLKTIFLQIFKRNLLLEDYPNIQSNITPKLIFVVCFILNLAGLHVLCYIVDKSFRILTVYCMFLSLDNCVEFFLGCSWSRKFILHSNFLTNALYTFLSRFVDACAMTWSQQTMSVMLPVWL